MSVVLSLDLCGSMARPEQATSTTLHCLSLKRRRELDKDYTPSLKCTAKDNKHHLIPVFH